MRRTRHPAARLLGALTALVTVWCLGCSAFDPLMAHLLGSGSAMMCASESGRSGAGEASDAATQTTTVVAPVAGEHGASSVSVAQAPGSDGLSCVCQSCNAASPATAIASSPAMPSPLVNAWLSPAALDLTRAPLVPPPERVV